MGMRWKGGRTPATLGHSPPIHAICLTTGASRPADSSRSMIEVEQKFALALNDPAARAALEDAIRAQGGVFKVSVACVGVCG